jgi:hypothetical protein
MSDEGDEVAEAADNAGLWNTLRHFFSYGARDAGTDLGKEAGTNLGEDAGTDLAEDAGQGLAKDTGSDLEQDATEEVRLMTLPIYRGAHFDDLLYGATYLRTDAERAPYLKYVGEDGLMYNQDGTLFDTRDMHTIPGTRERGCWTMDENGNFYAFQPQRLIFHHSSIVAGGEVASGGECTFIDGRLAYIDDYSGHYSPPRPWTEACLGLLKRQGLDFDSAVVKFRGATLDELKSTGVYERHAELGISSMEALRRAAVITRKHLLLSNLWRSMSETRKPIRRELIDG